MMLAFGVGRSHVCPLVWEYWRKTCRISKIMMNFTFLEWRFRKSFCISLFLNLCCVFLFILSCYEYLWEDSFQVKCSNKTWHQRRMHADMVFFLGHFTSGCLISILHRCQNIISEVGNWYVSNSKLTNTCVWMALCPGLSHLSVKGTTYRFW